ncbi:hypothetical protein OIU76_028928 [Salix suchowensis]|nr:hypothetical protein OIU76_028928 [Salix suchowensis]
MLGAAGRRKWMDRWTYQHSDHQLDQIDEPPEDTITYSPWAVGVGVAACACRTDRSYPGSLPLGNGQKVGGVRRFMIRHA